MSKLEQLRQRLASEPALQEILSNAITSAVGQLPSKTLAFSRFCNNDDHATIQSYDDSSLEPDFEFESLAAQNDVSFTLSFSTIVPATIYFYILKADYYTMEEDDYRPAVSDHNDHMYEAELETEVIVNGALTIYLDAETPISEPALIDEDSLEVAIKTVEDAKAE